MSEAGKNLKGRQALVYIQRAISNANPALSVFPRTAKELKQTRKSRTKSSSRVLISKFVSNVDFSFNV